MKVTAASAFGEELSAELHARQMKQAHLARLLGVSNAAVSSWTTGTSKPDPENAAKLEEVLDIRPRGRWLQMLGYAAPADEERQPPLEERIWAEDSISLEDRRAIVRFLTLARSEAVSASGTYRFDTPVHELPVAPSDSELAVLPSDEAAGSEVVEVVREVLGQPESLRSREWKLKFLRELREMYGAPADQLGAG